MTGLKLQLVIAIVFFASSPSSLFSQKIVVPEEIKKKCPDIPFEERVRLAISRFSKSTGGVNSANIDNFSSMLSNAMFEVDCFRMLSMIKDSLDNKDANETSDIKPQLLITGEITEYNHTVKETKVLVSKKVATIAHIGFILQIKDPVTRDVLFSKSFNEEGSSENKSLVVNLPKNPIPGQDNKVGTSSNDAIDKAYFDALEKGIIQAVTYIVDSRDKIYSIAKSTGNKTVITVLNTNFVKLMEIEKNLKMLNTVTKVDKALDKSDGKLTVYHSGKTDDLIGALSKMTSLDITGLEGTKITVSMKQ